MTLKGYRHTEEWKIEHSRKLTGRYTNDKNPMWKGDNVGYKGLHLWVRTHLPRPELCENCGLVPPYEVACITKIYNRMFENWRWLCIRCHRIRDNKLRSRAGPFKGYKQTPEHIAKRIQAGLNTRRQIKGN